MLPHSISCRPPASKVRVAQDFEWEVRPVSNQDFPGSAVPVLLDPKYYSVFFRGHNRKQYVNMPLLSYYFLSKPVHDSRLFIFVLFPNLVMQLNDAFLIVGFVLLLG